jgi:hypothetical protein
MSIGISVLFFVLIGIVFVIVREKVQWNRGICRVNGKAWKRFDTDSQGGKGYLAGEEVLWLSWTRGTE